MKTKAKIFLLAIVLIIFSSALSACTSDVKVLFFDGEQLLFENTIDKEGGFDVPQPTKTDYVFQGWFFDKECRNKLEQPFAEMPKEDVAVYAKWQPVGRITYVTNSAAKLDDTFAYGRVPFIPTNLKKENYTFEGWYFDNNTFQQSAEEVLKNTITDNHTVYAKWQYVFSKPDNPRVVINLADGRKIRLELFPDVAPVSVTNFLRLVDEGYYTNTVFHRIIQDFMIQTGMLEYTDGNLLQKPEQPNIIGEFAANGIKNDIKHTLGVISMARATAYDSGSAQFFICSVTRPHLDGEYAAFGKTLDAESDAAVVDLSYYPTQTYGGMGDFPFAPDGGYVIISSIERLQD